MNFDGIGEEETYETPVAPRPASGGGCGCRSGCLGIFLFLFLIFLVGVFLLLVFVPSYLNSPAGKEWAVRKLNAAIAPANVTTEQVKISWLGPTELTGVRYRSSETGVDVKADKVTSSLGFLRLIPVGVLNLGDVVVEHPVCTIRPPVPVKEEERVDGSFFLPVADIAARISIQDGALHVFTQDDVKPFSADTIFAHAAIPSYRKPISLDLRLHTGKEGRLTLNGSLQSLKEMQSGDRSESPRRLTATASSLDLPSLLGLFGVKSAIATGTAQGKLELEVDRTDSLSIDGDLTITKFSIATEKKNSAANDLTLRVKGGMEAGNIHAETLDIKTPWLSMNGNGMLAPQKKGTVMGALQCHAKIDLSRFTRDFRRLFRDLPPMGGTVELDLSTRQFAAMTGMTVFSRLSDFTVALDAKRTAAIPKGTLKFDGSVPFRDGGLQPELCDASWTFTSGEDSFGGSFERWNWNGMNPVIKGFRAKLDAAPIRIAALCGPFLPVEAVRVLRDLTGRVVVDTTAETEKGAVNARITANGDLLYPQKANGVADLAMTGFKGTLTIPTGAKTTFRSGGYGTLDVRLAPVHAYGLFAGEATLSANYSAGLLQLAYAPSLNGGKLKLKPDLHFRGTDVTVISPAKTRLFEKVEVTQPMIDNWLVAVNPFFERSRVKGGTMTVDVLRFELDGSKPPEKGLEAEFDLLFENIQLILGPAFDELLQAMNVNNRLYTAKSIPMHVTVKNGKVTIGRTHLSLDGQPFTFSGWTSFGGRIQYELEVPVTERICAQWKLSWLGKLFEGKTLPISITGTCDNPQIDLSAMAKSLQTLLLSGKQAMPAGNVKSKGETRASPAPKATGKTTPKGTPKQPDPPPEPSFLEKLRRKLSE
ncbi:MAG: hypothetical protein J6Z49_08400 [Kiritimatiellae bacterium]|nr:hypothetical protein [Kiritimatiellia bacterium]